MEAALVIALAMLLAGVQTGAAAPQDPPPSDFSMDVDLVVLQATVVDSKGRVPPDLSKEHFAIYEEGVRQPIRLFRHEDTPVTVGLVVDHSGSMGRKLDDVLAAARTFVESSRRADEMFVVNFNENVSLGLPDGVQFTSRIEDLTRAISDTPTTGQTALYDATLVALDHLRYGRRDKKVLIVISDGSDNASHHSLNDVLHVAGASNAILYTIGIADPEAPDRNPGVLKRLARETGGAAYFPFRSSEAASICARIAREIRDQYTLGYVPSAAAPPGSYRRIRVTASAAGKGKLTVRSRAGYYRVAAPKKDVR